MQHNPLTPIAIYGAGGFGRETACLIRLINEARPQWHLVGFFDDATPQGTATPYGPVLGALDALNAWPTPLSLVIAIGTPTVVQTLTQRIHNPNISFPNLIAPNAVLSDPATLSMGRGNIVGGFCAITCNVAIGDFNALNGYVTVGHDCRIGSFNSVMPATNISGEVEIGDCNFLGVRSVVLQGKKIGNHVRVGAGSVVMRACKDGNLYIGNPAVKVKL